MKHLSHSISPGGRQERVGAPTAQWSTASAVVIACAAAGLTGAAPRAEGSWFGRRPDAESQMALSGPQRTLVRLRPYDAMEWAGLGALVVALVLLAFSPYLARSRRAFVIVLLAGGILFLGVGGYVLYDIDYVRANLDLREDVAELQADCERLLRDRSSLKSQPGFPDFVLRDKEVPESMRRRYYRVAVVRPDYVAMLYGMAGGPVLTYDPHHVAPIWKEDPAGVRRMWFPGFYRYVDPRL